MPSGTPEQGNIGRRTVLKGVLGAGALVGTYAALTGPASASVDDGERGVEHGWGKVADAFRKNFQNPGEVGAACSVYVGGRPVVNLWGGLADREARRPWRRNTIVQVASTTKGATAICAHLLVQRGLLDLDAPVARYWPEFAAAGKEQIPVRWLLSHQAGLPIVDGPLTFEQACAWHPVIRELEAQKPLWQPGTEHVYHSVTYHERPRLCATIVDRRWVPGTGSARRSKCWRPETSIPTPTSGATGWTLSDGSIDGVWREPRVSTSDSEPRTAVTEWAPRCPRP
ncbi:serine hydrolase domain-containing protein [Nonomuraea fuscirosea]|uniref:serine hydrolase domain-containing protein n=1 Tax=Nonomuraea fuscirosea TaxID=1291556 RepID=UPI00341EC6C3